MGNSPSKDDPLPNTLSISVNGASASANSGVSSSPAGELESDDNALSKLLQRSQHRLQHASRGMASRKSPTSTSASSPSSGNAKPIKIDTSSATVSRTSSRSKLVVASSSNNANVNVHDSSASPSVNANANHMSSASYSAATISASSRGGRLDSDHRPINLEIDVSMARLMSSNFDLGSSVDSNRSTASTFTRNPANDEDRDLLSSVGSLSPPRYKSPTLSAATTTNSNATATSTPPPYSSSKYLTPPSSAHSRTKLRSRSLSSSNNSSLVADSPPLIPMNNNLEIDIDSIISKLLAIGNTKRSSSSRKTKDALPLSLQELKYILSKSRSIFMDQPSLLKLASPVKIVGDIHGQFHDLVRIFNACGYPPYTNYLFLGDYVDRGYRSLETIILLLCYKIKYPENFFMLRGNHESANITKIYGFYDECKRRLPAIAGSHKMWKSFIDVFNTLPFAATINDKIFCIHGGLSPDLKDLKQIENIKRPTDIPDRGLLADLLWSDPDPTVRGFSLTNWPPNDRGVSYCFGRKHVDYFCQQFKMDLIVRGHMVVEDGYEFFNKRKLVTVFSAPNYCGEFNNFGAVMSVNNSLRCSFELIKPQ